MVERKTSFWIGALALILAGCSGGHATGGDELSGDVAGTVDIPDAGFPDDGPLPEVPGEILTDPGGDPGALDGDSQSGDDGETADDGGSACRCAPPTVTLTVSRIPDSMNGSQPFLDSGGQWVDFRLALPTVGSLWEVTAQCPCGCEADGLETVAEPALPGGEAPFQFQGGGRWAWLADATAAIPATDPFVLTAAVWDSCGQASSESSLAVRTVDMTPLLDPFDLEDPWLLTYTRDHYTVTWTLDGQGDVELQSEEASNGIPDLLEDLWTIGMGTPNPTAAFSQVACEGGTGGNECLARLLLNKVRERMYPMFERLPDGTAGPDSVNIRLHLEGEADAPDPTDFAYQYLDGTESAKAFSMIGFGGGNLAADYVGMSESLDHRNVRNENNARQDYGVMTTSLIRYFYNLLFADPAVLELAQLFLGDLLPTLGGVPMGELDGDELAVDMAVPDDVLEASVLERRQTLVAAMDLVCGGLAALTAHEIGHSLGLVAYGPPPHGAFADEKLAGFIENPGGSVGPHIDTAGQNLMQAGPGSGNLPPMSLGFLMSPWFFNELNLAYLQGRVVLLPKE